MKDSRQAMNAPKDGPLEIPVHEVREQIARKDEKLRLMDLREERERTVGHIAGDVHLPESRFASEIAKDVPERDAPVVLYCAAGRRSLRTAALMRSMGYRAVKSMAGGFKAWVEAGYEIATKGALKVEQVKRYSRQMLLSEVGEEGQLKLLQSRVLLVGAGGLGSPIALYLAAAGVGALGIVDFDRVDLSNIHRQVLHGTADVGRPKTESAEETLRRINPDTAISVRQERLTRDNALELVQAYDIVADGSDNFETRFLLNDAAFFAGKPYVFGGAVRFGGQASVFYPAAGGPCLRCMIPEIPPPGTSPG